MGDAALVLLRDHRPEPPARLRRWRADLLDPIWCAGPRECPVPAVRPRRGYRLLEGDSAPGWHARTGRSIPRATGIAARCYSRLLRSRPGLVQNAGTAAPPLEKPPLHRQFGRRT